MWCIVLVVINIWNINTQNMQHYKIEKKSITQKPLN